MLRYKEKSRKIYYSSGMISIILLPILCILFFNLKQPTKALKGIPVTFWNKKWDNVLNYNYNVSLPLKFPKRNFKKIEIKRNNVISDITIPLIEKLNLDTLNGIQLQLTSNSSLEQLVQIVDILESKKINYILEKNSIWIYNLNKTEIIRPVKKITEASNYRCGAIHFQEPIKKEWDIYFIIKIFLLPVFLFLGMIFFTIYKSINSGKIKYN